MNNRYIYCVQMVCSNNHTFIRKKVFLEAGIAVEQTKSRKISDEKIEAVSYALFVPVFFISIGLNITFIAVLAIILLLSKLIGGGLEAR